jgi:hypothetical protein
VDDKVPSSNAGARRSAQPLGAMSEPLEYTYGGWGALMLYLALPFIGAIVATLLTCSLLMLFAADSTIWIRLQALFGVGISMWMGASLFHWIRDRHAFKTRYSLSEAGVFVEGRQGSGAFIPWSNFSGGVDCRGLRFISVSGGDLERPVVLLFGTPGSPSVSPTEKARLARELISRHLGSRLLTRWVA